MGCKVTTMTKRNAGWGWGSLGPRTRTGRIAQELLGRRGLSRWEREFLVGMRFQTALSEYEARRLMEIKAKYGT